MPDRSSNTVRRCGTADCNVKLPRGFLYCAEHASSERLLWRYRQALLDLQGDYGCTVVTPPDPSLPATGFPCRDTRPDEPETWCYACVASDALEDPL